MAAPLIPILVAFGTQVFKIASKGKRKAMLIK